MATTTRFSVAKTQKSYSPLGLSVVCGSKVKSETEQWSGGLAYPPSQNTTRLAPSSGDCA